MKITQLSLFVENVPGALNDICKVLQANSINISTLSLADTQSFGNVNCLLTNGSGGAKHYHIGII